MFACSSCRLSILLNHELIYIATAWQKTRPIQWSLQWSFCQSKHGPDWISQSASRGPLAPPTWPRAQSAFTPSDRLLYGRTQEHEPVSASEPNCAMEPEPSDTSDWVCETDSENPWGRISGDTATLVIFWIYLRKYCLWNSHYRGSCSVSRVSCVSKAPALPP